MDPSYVHRLHALLQQSTTNDTAAVKAATASLNTEFYRDPKCIPALFEIVASSPDQTIRQIASVELRKRVSQRDGALWVEVPQNFREVIKGKILETVAQEQTSIVRHAISRVIAAISENEISSTKWDALLPWLNQMTSSDKVTSREVGIYVLYTCIDTLLEANPNITREFLQHFIVLLSDPESLEVRSTALRSMVTLAQYFETSDKKEIAAYQNAIPAMVAVVQSAIEARRDEVVRHSIDGFQTLLILEVPLLTKHIPQLVEFFTTVGANRNLDSEYRVSALNALSWIIKYKKNKVQNLNLAEPILQSLLIIGAEDEPEDGEEEVPARSAFRVIDTLATALPPSHVFNPLSQLVAAYAQNPDPALRKSALTSLGLAVEGCSEYIRPNVDKLWPFIDAGFQDPIFKVRNAACIAFGCVCEWLPEPASERHAIIMPALMSLMSDPATQSAAGTALDSFLEILGAQITQYIDLIMERLSILLETAPIRTKAIVTGAIGSAAHAAGPAFKPYFTATLQRLQPFFLLTGEGEEQELRGIAMDALGTLAESIGREDFRPYFSDTMLMAKNGADSGSARLKECSFLLYSVLSRVFEKEFSPYLPGVVPALLTSCQQPEQGEDLALTAEIEKALNADSTAAFSTGESVDGDDVDVEDNSSVDAEKTLAVNSAIAVEKEIAADTLGGIFVAVGADFLPYLEGATKELLLLLDHYYEGIRKSAISSLFEFIKTFNELSNAEAWQPGLPVVIPLHDKVKELVSMILPPIIQAWDEEDDKAVVSQLCQSLSEAIAKVGPGLVEAYLNEICTYTLKILERKSLCQQDPDQDEDEQTDEDEEQAEYESVLISSASDVVGALASVLGPDFSEAFKSFIPPLFSYYTKGRSASDRSSSIGSLGEVITGLKGGVTEYTQPLLEHIGKAFTDPELEVRSNAAFAMGALIENSQQDLTGQYQNLLAGLRPYFQFDPDKAPEPAFVARDNAIGAVSRMIVKNMPPAQIEVVLPTLIEAIPISKDFLENRPLFTALFYLFQNTPQLVTPHLDRLLRVFAHVLDPNQPDQIGDDVRAQLITLIRALNGQFPSQITASGLQVFVN